LKKIVCFCQCVCNVLLVCFSFSAHSAALTCVGFSVKMNFLTTGSIDTELKLWNGTGGHIHTFRSHSKAITRLVSIHGL